MNIATLENCCGCGNCALVCKQTAITISIDPAGFYKRKIEDSKCINCHACELACPIVADTKRYRTSLGTRAYFARIVDTDVLSVASSGGIASAISISWLRSNKGVVYGSRYTVDFRSVQTVRVSATEELKLLYGSKYVQSYKGNVFQSVKEDLISGMQVLYIGLPCDIAALKIFLRKEYINLYTCELICHGTTSTTAFCKFINFAKDKFKSDITSVNMRFKKNGKWTPYHFVINFNNGTQYLRNFWETEFGFAFSRFRNSACYRCPFKGENRCADLTLGDAWGADKEIIDANLSGMSSVLLNTPKGVELFTSVIKNGEVYAIETTKETIVKGNPNLLCNEDIPEDYEAIKEEFCNNGLISAAKRFRPLRTRVIIAIKRIMRKS